MNILLIFFALPIATIIISIALQKILKCPLLVAAVIFAIFLIVTFIIDNLIFLVAAIVYAILSFITAAIVCLACRLLNRRDRENAFLCCNNTSNELLAISANTLVNNRDSTCNCNNSSFGCNGSNNAIDARINVIPNSNNNGRTGCICGNFRRR